MQPQLYGEPGLEKLFCEESRWPCSCTYFSYEAFESSTFTFFTREFKIAFGQILSYDELATYLLVSTLEFGGVASASLVRDLKRDSMATTTILFEQNSHSHDL